MSTQSVDRAAADARVAASVRALMAYHGLTKAELADALGTTVGTLERRLSLIPGPGRAFYAQEVQTLSAAFGLPVGEFYEGDVNLAASRRPEFTAPPRSPFRRPKHKRTGNTHGYSQPPGMDGSGVDQAVASAV